jgi:hypothetical protein
MTVFKLYTDAALTYDLLSLDVSNTADKIIRALAGVRRAADALRAS